VKLIVRTRGGLLGFDRQVELDGRTGTVREQGRSRPLELAAEQAERLADAARRIEPGIVDSSGAQDAVDGGVSEIEVLDGSRRTLLTLPAGATAPDAVWELLDLVDAACAGD
jgi:hypothetical protein